MKWDTKFTRLFSCQVPVMGAPMAGAAGGLLAAEVCKAGGLGFIAAGHLNSKESLQNLVQEIELFQEVSGEKFYPLCIGVIGYSTFATEDGSNFFENVLENHQPTCVQFFAPAISILKHDKKTKSAIDLSHSYGCKVIAQVGTEEEGIKALEAGADCLIAQGTEAGGHGVVRELGCGTFTLTSRLVKRAKGK
jgi:nitronate monooxygenase